MAGHPPAEWVQHADHSAAMRTARGRSWADPQPAGSRHLGGFTGQEALAELNVGE